MSADTIPQQPDLYALLTKEAIARIAQVNVKTIEAMDAADPIPWFVPEGTTRKRITLAGWYVYIARKQNAALHQ